MKQEDSAFLTKHKHKHKASLLGVAAIGAILVLLSMQFGFHLSADGLDANQTLEIGRGESQILNLTISGGMGFKILGATSIGKIYLDAVDVPAGLNASAHPSTGCPLFYSNVTIRADDNAAEGSKKIVFRAVGPLGEDETLEINLNITANRYFELVGDTAEIAVRQNRTGAIPVHIIRDPGYIEPISFKASGLPAGVVPVFDPASSLPGKDLSTLLLKINPDAKAGRYNFSILGTGADNITADCNLSLKIEPDRYFSISVIPSIVEINAGNKSSLLLEIDSVNNYTGKVKLSVLNYPINIINANIDRPIADLSSSQPKYKSNLKLQLSDDAIPGKSYYFVVNGLGQDGYSMDSSIVVIVEGTRGSFKIKPQFKSLQLNPGETKSSEILIEGSNGYEGKITLSASDVPGITANIDPDVVFVDSQNSIASSHLSVYAQAEDDLAINSDIIISGYDSSQNSDESRIGISILPGSLATEQPVIEQPVIEQPVIEQPAVEQPPVEQSAVEQPVIEPATVQVIPPENAMPTIRSLSPSINPIYSDQVAKFIAKAIDPENDLINYRFLLNGRLTRDWSEKNTAEILMKAGENEIEVQVIDGMHNGIDMYDDNKIIKITVYPEVQVDPSYENTTCDEFFNEITGKDFNYNNIPIESVSSATRGRWYRNDQGSANYVGEYEIRKELFYSKSDYTIKLVLDNQSKPIDVIFLQDSNVVLQVPSGFVEQAIRKLSNL